MDILAPVRAFDRFQQRHAALGVPMAVVKKFSDDGAGNAAALIAYWGFFSIFPLLLLLVTILGFVLHGNPDAQQAVVDSALAQIPAGVGNKIQAGTLDGSGVGLAVGIAGTVLAGLGVTLAAQNAFNTVYNVPRRERPNFLVARLRGLLTLVVLGILQLVATLASGLVTGGLGGLGLTIAGIVVSLVVNVLLFATAFRLLTDEAVSTRELWPGVLIASVLWAILQAVGGVYINHVVAQAGSTYGTFALVIGLLTWLYLGARIVVYSAEVNTVLTRGLWPRSLLDPPSEADREVLTALAKTEERKDNQRVDVRFE